MLVRLPIEVLLNISERLNRVDKFRLATSCRQLWHSLAGRVQRWNEYAVLEFNKEWTLTEDFRRFGHVFVETLILGLPWVEQMGNAERPGVLHLDVGQVADCLRMLDRGAPEQMLHMDSRVIKNYLPLILPSLSTLDYLYDDLRGEEDLFHPQKSLTMQCVLKHGLLSHLAHLRMRPFEDGTDVVQGFDFDQFMCILSLPSLYSLYIESLAITVDSLEGALQNIKLRILQIRSTPTETTDWRHLLKFFDGLELFDCTHRDKLGWGGYSPPHILLALTETQRHSLRKLSIKNQESDESYTGSWDDYWEGLCVMENLQSLTCQIQDIWAWADGQDRLHEMLPLSLRDWYITDMQLKPHDIEYLENFLAEPSRRNVFSALWLRNEYKSIRQVCRKLNIKYTVERSSMSMPWLKGTDRANDQDVDDEDDNEEKEEEEWILRLPPA